MCPQIPSALQQQQLPSSSQSLLKAQDNVQLHPQTFLLLPSSFVIQALLEEAAQPEVNDERPAFLPSTSLCALEI